MAGLGRTEHNSISSLVIAAENSVRSNALDSLPSNIWDADKTSKVETYWDKSYTGNETILDYSPVRNFLMAFINFRN